MDLSTPIYFETPEAGSGGEAPAETGGESAAPSVDVSALTDRLESFGEKLGGIEERLGLGEQEQFADPYDDSGGDDGEYADDDQGQQQQYQDPAELEQQQALQALEQYIGEQVEQRVGPIQQQASESERYIELTQLEDAYPDLRSEEIAGPLFQECLELGHSMGMSRDQATHPDFIEKVYLAGRNLSAAAGETPAGEQPQGEMPLEGAGGAYSGQTEEDPAMAIVNAGPRRNFLTGH